MDSSSTIRIRIDVAYLGHLEAGWQIQLNQPTIQSRLQDAIEKIALHPIHVAGAGRTDSGVHAAQQVACFNTTTARPLRAWVKGVNRFLPRHIVVQRAQEVQRAFHPRHSPHVKLYEYRFHVAAVEDPLRAGQVWRVDALDGLLMNSAAGELLGTRDFSCFRAAGCASKHPIRTLERVQVVNRGDEWVLCVEGTGFLRHMVRNIAGTLFEIGRGRRQVAWLKDVLDSRDRGQAGQTAPAQGLCLREIRYTSVA